MTLTVKTLKVSNMGIMRIITGANGFIVPVCWVSKIAITAREKPRNWLPESPINILAFG